MYRTHVLKKNSNLTTEILGSLGKSKNRGRGHVCSTAACAISDPPLHKDNLFSCILYKGFLIYVKPKRSAHNDCHSLKC